MENSETPKDEIPQEEQHYEVVAEAEARLVPEKQEKRPAAPVSSSYSQKLPSHLPDDNFSKARIVKYFPQSHYGFIKDHRGKDVYFNVDELRFVGEKGRESLREGAWVGFDVGRTSHGMHVAKMKIY